MSTKHNTKHYQRGKSRYPERLRKRGLSNVDVRMRPLEELRRIQLARQERTGFPWRTTREENEEEQVA